MSIWEDTKAVPTQNAGEEAQGENAHMGMTSKYNIVFSPEHELCRVWRLWTGVHVQTDPLSIPVLIHGQPEQAQPSGKLEREYRRLEILLGYIGRARLNSICHQAPEGEAAVDEGAFVVTSSDEMNAWLIFFPPVRAGKTLTSEQIWQLLLHRGVTQGVDWNLICSLPAQPERYFKLFHVAEGTQPVAGEDGRVIDKVPRVLEDAQATELGKMNYETLNLVTDIRQDDVICEIVPPTAGFAGRTVTGKMVPARPGKGAEIPQGRNTKLSEDGRYLLAQRDGHVCFTGREFQVRPVRDVQEGEIPPERSIKFLGDIHVHGDLRGGVTVCATGNIQVDGVVENCVIEAGENIIVSSGVQGQGHAVLRSQRSIYAKYLEQCEVFALESVQADCIINCNIYCDGTVKARTGRGTIIGGTVHAAWEVSAVTVGSKAERPTLVVLGGQPCEKAEREEILAEIQAIDQELSRLEREPKIPVQDQRKSKLRLNQCVAKLKLEKIDKELASKAAACLEQGMCKLVCNTVYPGTTVTIGHGSLRVTQEEYDCNIGLQDGFVCRR